jgi:hypothetical protein
MELEHFGHLGYKAIRRQLPRSIVKSPRIPVLPELPANHADQGVEAPSLELAVVATSKQPPVLKHAVLLRHDEVGKAKS